VTKRYEIKAPQSAQGGIAQEFYFKDHAIVYIDNKYFDPSYGIPATYAKGFLTLSEWEDAALADQGTGYHYIGIWNGSDEPNQIGIEEIRIK